MNTITTGQAQAEPAQHKTAYFALHAQLSALWAAPVRDMAAIDAVIQKLDEVHADFKAAQRSASDTQRY